MYNVESASYGRPVSIIWRRDRWKTNKTQESQYAAEKKWQFIWI